MKDVNQGQVGGRLKKNESGVVAIFVTLILMVVLSVIVLGFSQIARTEQRNALDRQLSLEAFYAAESGVNDAYSVVSNAINNNQAVVSNTSSCQGSNTYITGNSNVINSASNTEYTCLLVNPEPPTLTYKPGAGQAVIADLVSANSNNKFNKLNIEWENDDPNTGQSEDSANCNQYKNSLGDFLPYSSWSTAINICPPVLLVNLVPIKPPFSEASLIADEATFELYPQSAAVGHVSFNAIKNGTIYGAVCATTCNFVVQGLTLDEYYIRIQYAYGAPPTISFSGFANGGNSIDFSKDEVQIDATGRAQDVLRRIQVDIALNSSVSNGSNIPQAPNYAIQVNSTLCKRLVVGLNGVNNFAYENIPSSVPKDVATTFNPYGLGKIFNVDTVAPPPNLSPSGILKNTDSCNPYF